MLLRFYSPMVGNYYEAALKHRDSANTLLADCNPNSSNLLAAEAVYLGGYVVECLLKATLLSRHRPRKHAHLEKQLIRVVRHDLDRLRIGLENLKKPIMFPPDVLRSFRLVRRHWNSNMRYSGRPLPTAVAVEFNNATEQIANWVIGRP